MTPKTLLTEWHDRLDALFKDVKSWVEKSGRRTRVIYKPMKDQQLRSYKAPVLLMERDTIEVALNPVSRFASAPTDRWISTSCQPTPISPASTEGGQWIIHYVFHPDSIETNSANEDESLTLSQDTINRVLNAIVAHV